MGKEQNSLVSLAHWNMAPDFTGDEITALVLGEDPSHSTFAKNKSGPLYRKLEMSYNASRRWHDWDDHAPLKWHEIGVANKNELLHSVGMEDGLSHFDPDDADNRSRWLASDEYSGFATQRFSRAEVARWLTACGIPSVFQFIGGKPKQESLSTKERNTLLKMIVGMAIRAYKYEPKSKNNGVAIEEIRQDLEEKGIPLSDDTIRNYLKEAVETVLDGKKVDQM